MLKANYHAHSVYCNHSSETLESLIKLAIKYGYREFGISEHGPIINLIGNYRINEDTEEKYLLEMKKLKIKYQNQITIYAGYEADLMNYKTGESNIDWIIKKLENPNLDYLLLANHTYGCNGHSYVKVPSLEEAKAWVALTKKAWKTGKFKYMVHPDGFANAYAEASIQWDEAANYMAEEITKFAAENNMPLGLNVNGIRDGKAYPSLKFWKIAAKNSASAIIELDAHDSNVFEDQYLKIAYQMANEAGVKIINKLNF